MRVIFFATLVSLSSLLGFAQAPFQQLTSEHGTYAVGYTHYISADSTRTYSKVYDWNNTLIPRPIPISIWYPAVKPSPNTSSIKILTYLETLKVEKEWEHLPNEHLLNWFRLPTNTPQNKALLKEYTKAFLDIPALEEAFPVLIYAPGEGGTSIENFALFEYLASHGYVIISSPHRQTDDQFDGSRQKNLETQARDIEFLVREALSMPNVDTQRMATIGHSVGGLSHLLSYMRNGRFKAIVSLDGSVKYQYPLLQNSPYWDIDKLDIPFIHMAQKDIPEAVLIADNIPASLNYEFAFYDSLRYSDAYSLKFHHLTHSYFTSFGVLFQSRDPRQDKSHAEIATSYTWVSRYTLQFLNAHLKKDVAGLQFLQHDPKDNEVPDSLISMKRKEAILRPFSFQDFNEVAKKQRYTDLQELYSSILEKHPSFKVPEGNLNNLGLKLSFNPATSEQGIAAFLFAVHLYPQSANLFDSLGEAYLHIGNKKEAIESFKKSLELDSSNQNAINRLSELEN